MWIVKDMRVYRKDKDETHLEAVTRLGKGDPFVISDFLGFQTVLDMSEADAAWETLCRGNLFETIPTQVWQGPPLTDKGIAA